MAKSTVDEAPIAPTAVVGVLFVHGIGAQAKGAALEEGANAIQAALHSQTEFDGVPLAERLTAEFGPVDLAGPGPANANLFVHAGVDASPQRWLLAESHWADAFRPPGLTATLTWILIVSPVLLLSRAVESAATALKAWWKMPLYWWRIAIAVLWVIAVAPIGVVLVAGLTLTVLLRFLIPIQFIKDVLGRLEVIVTAYLGDSYLFTGNEVSRAAMTTRVADDIEWLTKRADRVVVVSHSQGAAVTAQALASTGPVDTLITYGAGIGQLDWLRKAVVDASTRRWRNYQFLLWVGVLVTFGQLVAGAMVIISGEVVTERLLLGSAMLAVFLAMVVSNTREVIQDLARTGRAPVGRPGSSVQPDKAAGDLAVRWWDLWASADPVPGGPSTAYSYHDVNPYRVFNRGNFLTDHSTYYRNREEFVGRVLLAAMKPPDNVLWSSQRASVQAGTADFLAAALPLRSCLRQRRGRWLEAWRAALALLTVAVMWRWLPQIAEGVGGSTKWLAEMFPAFAGTIRTASDPGVRIVLAVLIVALGAIVVYGVSLVLWWGWARVERRIINSDLRLEEMHTFGAQIRLSRPQLPFLMIAAAAPTLAIGAAAFVLFGDVDLVPKWIESWWNAPWWKWSVAWWEENWPFPVFVAAVALFVYSSLPRRRSIRNRGKAMTEKGALPLLWSLSEKFVRDPRVYRPFRHANIT